MTNTQLQHNDNNDDDDEKKFLPKTGKTEEKQQIGFKSNGGTDKRMNVHRRKLISCNEHDERMEATERRLIHCESTTC